MEREVLLAKAPHISWPLRFVLPHEPHLRPRWMLRLGLFLYDHLDWHMTLPKSEAVDLRTLEIRRRAEACVQEGLRLLRRLGRRCPAGDRQRRSRRATWALRSTPAIAASAARRSDDGKLWEIELAAPDGGARAPHARAALVNAAGPWVKHFLDEQTHVKTPKRVRLIKGSHIIVPRLHEGDHAFILQNKRQPHRLRHSLRARLLADRHDRHSGRDRARTPVCTPEEIAYLCELASHYMAKPVPPAGCRLDLFGRAAAVRRRRRQSLGRDARLPSRGRCAAAAPRPCCRCSAARSRPTAGSPSMRWRISRKFYPRMAGAWTAGKALADGELADAPTFEAGLRPLRRRRRPGRARPAARIWCGCWRAATAPASTSCSKACAAWPISAGISAAISTRSRCAT